MKIEQIIQKVNLTHYKYEIHKIDHIELSNLTAECITKTRTEKSR